ncbi:MAG: hypothetical protein PHH70_04900 [Candidatus Gracilibacteria bacterium]|nr:hypothetical protein [Candidatus Gracilibacteria bacterium]
MFQRFLILITLCSPLSALALGMDVTADIPSGTYHAPIHVTLTPSESRAKTFYSFKPDGTPNDAILYTGSVLLKHSTPFIYFSFLTTDIESKIKQNDYIFEYPGSVHFETDTVVSSGVIQTVLINNGKDDRDIGWWYVESETDRAIIPEGTVLIPGAKYALSIKYAGTSSVVLRSPDDDEKDILFVQTPLSSSLAPKKPVTVKVVPRKIISTRETLGIQPEVVSTGTPSISSTSTLSVPENNTNPTPINDAVTTHVPAPQADLNTMIKVSAQESGSSRNLNPLYLLGLLVVSFGIGGVQWYVRRRQK